MPCKNNKNSGKVQAEVTGKYVQRVQEGKFRGYGKESAKIPERYPGACGNIYAEAPSLTSSLKPIRWTLTMETDRSSWSFLRNLAMYTSMLRPIK